MLELASENRVRSLFRFFYRTFISPIIIKKKIPLIRVVDSNFVEKHYAIPLKKTKLLSFGTDVDHFIPNLNFKNEFREKNNIGLNDFVVIYAGKLDEFKGGAFLANSLKPKIVLEKRKICFIIIGNTKSDYYGQEVEKTLLESQNKIIKLPTQSYLDLSKFYQAADIAIFPKQCSMSYFEVQSCGLPVVLEHNEINLDRISNKKGLIFNKECKVDFVQKIVDFGNMNKEEFDIFSKNSRQNILTNYNYSNVAKAFTDILINEYNRYKTN